MREKLKRIAEIFKIIFGYGILCCLFVGGVTFFGYMAALVIGGETAVIICKFIYKTVFPVIIKASTILVLFGIGIMYLAGEKSLSADNRKKD